MRFALAVALSVMLAAPVLAHGSTRVEQSDGTVQTYDDVGLRLAGDNLWVTSADHRGVLEIADGACSFVGELRRCLPFAVTLHQHGATHPIPLEHGTVFINPSSAPQELRHSSQRVGPHSVLIALHTQRGTYIEIRGHLDEAHR